MSDIHTLDVIRAFNQLFRSCAETENNATDKELPLNLAFGCGVYTAACSIMGEDSAKQLTDLNPIYASEESISRLKPKLRVVK